MLRVAVAASTALFENTGDAIDDGNSAATQAVVRILAETIGESLPLLDVSPGERALTARFERVLDDRLMDAELTAEVIADELGVTPQYLNRVLGRSGPSISRRILARRLYRCADELRSMHVKRVGDIAFRWGFNDLSHFSRSFKEAYGVGPREYQAAHHEG